MESQENENQNGVAHTIIEIEEATQNIRKKHEGRKYSWRINRDEEEVLYKKKRDIIAFSDLEIGENGGNGICVVVAKTPCRKRDICDAPAKVLEVGKILEVCECRMEGVRERLDMSKKEAQINSDVVRAITRIIAGRRKISWRAIQVSIVLWIMILGCFTVVILSFRSSTPFEPIRDSLVAVMLAFLAAVAGLAKHLGSWLKEADSFYIPTFTEREKTLGSALNSTSKNIIRRLSTDFGDSEGVVRIPGTYINENVDREVMDAVLVGMVTRSILPRLELVNSCVLGTSYGTGNVYWDVICTQKRLEKVGLFLFDSVYICPDRMGLKAFKARQVSPTSHVVTWEPTTLDGQCQLRWAPPKTKLA